MRIVYQRQGMCMKVYLVVEGENVYVGFWYTFLEFVDDSEQPEGA